MCLRYLKAAFWLTIPIPGFGRVPLNAIIVLGLGILGFGNPGFWLLGLGIEGAWLVSAANSNRFRALIDARGELTDQSSAGQQRLALIGRLNPDNRSRMIALELKSRRAIALQREAGVSEMMCSLNADSLSRLEWFFLKLLVARENLQALGDKTMRRSLEQQAATLEKELEMRSTAALRDSKEATLKILHQRLAHVDRREESIAKIDSDLTRIDAQIDLAVDSAGLRGKDSTVSTDIHFVSQFLDDSIYGDSSASIAALDQSYSAPQRRRVAE